MNKKYQQMVPIVILLAVVIFCGLIFVLSQTKINEYIETLEDIEKNKETKLQLEEQAERERNTREAIEMKMRSLKSVYKSEVKGSVDDLSAFGSMFGDIIKKAQGNGLMIRSIEYVMNPAQDVLYSKFPNKYNACELKFFFVSTYGQLADFLIDMNINYEYLVTISELKATAFEENPDYLLSKLSIIIYSDKME